MEKVYMEAPKQSNRLWKPEDISPYDFKDDINMHDSYDKNDDEFDMDALLDEMNRMDDDMNYDHDYGKDRYDDFDWKEMDDANSNGCKSITMDRKTVVEEENPKRKTTTWMRMTKQY